MKIKVQHAPAMKFMKSFSTIGSSKGSVETLRFLPILANGTPYSNESWGKWLNYKSNKEAFMEAQG